MAAHHVRLLATPMVALSLPHICGRSLRKVQRYDAQLMHVWRAPVRGQVVEQDALRHAGLHGRHARRLVDPDREAGRHADAVAWVEDPVSIFPISVLLCVQYFNL